MFGKLGNLQQSFFFNKIASLFMVFFGGGPHGARDHWGPRFLGPIGQKIEKLDFLYFLLFCPIWGFRGFWYDRNERKHIQRRHRPRVSNFLSHRIVESLKCMIFDILGKSLHHQMILGPPDGSLDFF